MVWGAGTLHNNYDNVTCVWQGSYDYTLKFRIDARYSNDTHEEYEGSIDLEAGTMTGTYIWYGYGRQSSGKFEALLRKTNQSIALVEDDQSILAC